VAIAKIIGHYTFYAEVHNIEGIINLVWNWKHFCKVQKNKDKEVWREWENTVSVV
jgi:hypothetical protein